MVYSFQVYTLVIGHLCDLQSENPYESSTIWPNT